MVEFNVAPFDKNGDGRLGNVELSELSYTLFQRTGHSFIRAIEVPFYDHRIYMTHEISDNYLNDNRGAPILTSELRSARKLYALFYQLHEQHSITPSSEFTIEQLQTIINLLLVKPECSALNAVKTSANSVFLKDHFTGATKNCS